MKKVLHSFRRLVGKRLVVKDGTIMTAYQLLKRNARARFAKSGTAIID
ncbi:hypothetical protein NLM33_23215 [Bradyrhizobium sp. CCGUVB1N3]|nr:hypothetical protein [Bradyrhizobium sp. CCGUVB1N3]MCP3473226.1 hypothetical protein [Bradyrhizobium sp. CCGUVB1N3]